MGNYILKADSKDSYPPEDRARMRMHCMHA